MKRKFTATFLLLLFSENKSNNNAIFITNVTSFYIFKDIAVDIFSHQRTPPDLTSHSSNLSDIRERRKKKRQTLLPSAHDITPGASGVVPRPPLSRNLSLNRPFSFCDVLRFLPSPPTLCHLTYLCVSVCFRCLRRAVAFTWTAARRGDR